MQKIKVRKDVAEQVTSKLKTLKNENIKPEFAEKLQKSALNSQNEQITSKLQANKNIFTRGDFDEYKISDEELKDLESRHYFSESELRKKGERLLKIYEKICKDTGLTMSEVVNRYGITDDDCYYDLQNPTEKFYYDLKMQFAKADDEVEKGIRTVIVPPSNGRKGYQYQRDFSDKEEKKESKKQYEERKEKCKLNLQNWATQENYDSAKGLTKEQIELRFGNEIKPLFVIPKNILKRFKGVKNDNAYCAKWYFMDHMVNHHPTIPVKDYHRIQFIVDNYTELYWDNKNKSLIIAKNYGNKIRDYVILHKEPNETFSFYKTYYNSKKKVPKKFKEIKKSVMEGLPYLHQFHLAMAAGGQNISGRHNNSNIAHCDNLSSKNITKSLFTDWKVELHHLCDKKGLDYDSVIQKYDDKLTRYVAEEQLHQDAENVIAYKAYKDLNKSLTYSGHKLQGRTKLYGMDISIENKKGSYRSGVDKDGHKWKVLMHYDYGYIRGTVGTDSDHLDTYVGPDKNATKVYVIHQNDPVTHKYDEDKCMLCFSSAADAKAAYMKQYDRPGFYGSMTTMTIDQFKSFVFSHKGQMIHKSFDINITDITENNKQQKLEQVNKALNAIANNQPFMIKHIPADASTNYGNLLVKIRDFDKSKIEKAVHKIALSLDADISGASKGEAFVYKAQEEIVDKYFKEFTNRTRAVYNFVISYFDLPDIRIVSKAGELRHKGKILYNPETGKPIQESEWKRFIVELEKFLNRNYTGIGEKIVLSAESLGIILDRLSKTNSLEAIRKMSVSDLKAKRYDVDWIGESIKNMKDKFGDVISRERQARIQIAMDSAAQRVTKVKDDIRNNIQQIIIDGIRDKQGKSVVAQNLFDKCASLNRDMQRIADSEVQMAANSAYCKEEVYNSEPGEKVYFKRFEMIDDNTCKECKKLNGTIVLWSDVPLPDEHIKDPFAKYAIWEGKNEGSCPIGIVHPYCYSDDTEVMTNNGWKLFKDVEKNDKIMSINPETKEIDFVPYVQKIQYEYNGDMIHFPGRNFDMLVTPDHNMLYLAGNGHGERQLKGIKASELIKNTAFALPRAMGEWKHTDAKTVKFGDLIISKAQYFRLWAWYLAEGSGRLKNGHYEVKLAQKEPIKIYNDLPELQSILHINSDCVCLHGDYARYFECMFGIYVDKKFIPPFIKNSSVENIREFLDAFVMADGTRFINKKSSSKKAYSEFRNEQVLRTSSKKMADDLCEMIVKAGWMPSEFVVHEKGKINHFKNGDYVLNTDCHNITICKSKTRTYAPDTEGHKPRHKPAYEKYNGMVYDVELEKWHFLLVRRNGKCGWSGNCRGSWTRYYPELD